MRYPLVIHYEPNCAFGVIVPDVPGCFSAGDTLDEAVEQAREAIILHLEGLAEDGVELPDPRPAEEHRNNPDYADAQYWAFVDVPEHHLPGKAVRLNITMNDRVLTRLDAVAKAEGNSRSGLLQRLASDYVAGRTVTPAKRSNVTKPRRKATGRKRARSS